MFSPRVVRALCCLIIAIPGTAQAQDVPLARILNDFFTEAVSMTSGTGSAGNPHEAHFFPGLSLEGAPRELQKGIVTQLSTFPLGTSSGGFTYTIDPATGAFAPGSTSFGPSFAERPFTIGKGKFSSGIQYQHVEYDSFEDISLDNEQIAIVLQHNNCCPFPAGTATNAPTQIGNTLPFFEGDLIETRMALNVKNDATVVSASYGVTNTFEIGVAVPFVRSELRVGGHSEIIRLSTGTTPLIHSWDGLGGTVKELPVRGGSASGLGDMLIRGKYAFIPGALAGEVDVRLPTGDEADLLGTGATQTRVMLIAAYSRSRIAPHVNVGYVFSKGSVSEEVAEVHVPDVAGAAAVAGVTPAPIDLDVPDEFTYTVGFDFAAHRRVTIAADVIGRVQRDVQRFEMSDSAFPYRVANDGPVQTHTRQALNLRELGNLNLALGAAGAKINVATNLLVTMNVLFPLTKGGLRPQVTPVIGLDYAF